MYLGDTPSHSGQFQTEFNKLSIMTVASLVGFGLILLAIIGYAGTTSNSSASERERVLLRNALNRGIARMLSEQKSVAWWDDSVTNITEDHIDTEFTNANFGVFLTETYRHDEVYILTAKGKPLYAFSNGEQAAPSRFEQRREVLQPVIDEVAGRAAASNDMREKVSALRKRPDVFGADQDSYRVLIKAVENARWSGHILEIDGKLTIVTAISILPNVNMDLLKTTPNILISTQVIDKDYVSDIARMLAMPDLALVAAPPATNKQAYEPIVGDEGAEGGFFVWTPEKPGQLLLGVILPLVAVGLIGVWLLTNRILSRLKSTSDTLACREEQAVHAARHDALSGLPNRTHFAERLRVSLKKLERNPLNHRVVIAYIDIDNFKDVNDTLGHLAGDALIKAVAERLKQSLRSNDFLARYGGDEFSVLWIAPMNQSGSLLGARISEAFEEPFQIDGRTHHVTASVGIAAAPEHGASDDELLRHADIALYEAKKNGKKQAILFSLSMEEAVFARREIEVDLQRAMGRNEFYLVYQPIVAANSKKIIGVEALLRWKHPQKGEISPATFIPVAEQAGLMPELGEWVLARAMQDLKRWPDLEVSVNLSPVQFRETGFVDRIRRLVSTHEADPRRFVLEVTEGVLLESHEMTMNALDAIHDMGFRTALDDFGTGYSSLAYLCNFRFNKIKIDRSFVSGMAKSSGYQKIIRAIIALGRGLGMTVVAEGVETEADAHTMRDLGCGELQGYHFAKPLTLENLKEFIARQPAIAKNGWRQNRSAAAS